jgi:hypothetical protein
MHDNTMLTLCAIIRDVTWLGLYRPSRPPTPINLTSPSRGLVIPVELGTRFRSLITPPPRPFPRHSLVP